MYMIASLAILKGHTGARASILIPILAEKHAHVVVLYL